MGSAQPAGIEEIEKDTVEMTITISPEFIPTAEDREFLKAIVTYACESGYSRFAGAIRGADKKGIKILFFSIPGYYDKDDMLVADSELRQKVDLLMAE